LSENELTLLLQSLEPFKKWFVMFVKLLN